MRKGTRNSMRQIKVMRTCTRKVVAKSPATQWANISIHKETENVQELLYQNTCHSDCGQRH